MRKIIQIDSSISKLTNQSLLNALCDDGTVWQKIGSTSWKKIEAIPQNDVDLDSNIPQNEQPE